MEEYAKNSIKSWAVQDRPREKLFKSGPESLSDAELIALLLRSGSQGNNVVQLSRELLRAANNNLAELSRYTVSDYTQFKGIGRAKAVTLAAALELGRRRQTAKIGEKFQIRGSEDVYACIGPAMRDLKREEFWVLLLNQANRVIGKEQISKGGISGTVVDVRLIFQKALERSASAIILAHNHPSGNLRPSDADTKITRKVKRGGENLDIRVLDHLIIAGDHYYSFADEGMM